MKSNSANFNGFIDGFLINFNRLRLVDWVTILAAMVMMSTESELSRAKSAIIKAGQNAFKISDRFEENKTSVSYGTMHLAKGLEFRSVVVMACDEDILPQQERLERVTDSSDLAEVYDTERQLLYVACTRARDHLLIVGVIPGSEFLEDLKQF